MSQPHDSSHRLALELIAFLANFLYAMNKVLTQFRKQASHSHEKSQK